MPSIFCGRCIIFTTILLPAIHFSCDRISQQVEAATSIDQAIGRPGVAGCSGANCTEDLLLLGCYFDTDRYSTIVQLKPMSAYRNIAVWGGHSKHTSLPHGDIDKFVLAAGRIYTLTDLGGKLLMPMPFLLQCPQFNYPLHISSCLFSFGDNSRLPYQRSPKQTAENNAVSSKVLLRNFTNLGSAASLFLDEGITVIHRCTVVDSLNNQTYHTDPKDHFAIDVQFEKPIGSQCDYSQHRDSRCGPERMYYCDKQSRRCACSEKNSPTFRNSFGTFCLPDPNAGIPIADPLNECNRDPEKCLTWCNRTRNGYCMCPEGLAKVARNLSRYNQPEYICAIPAHGMCPQIHFGQTIHCTIGATCFNGYCMTRQNKSSHRDVSVINRLNPTRDASKARQRQTVPTSSNAVVIKAYLVALSVVLSVVLCALTFAVCKLQIIHKKFSTKSNSRPSVFLPIDSSTASSKLDRCSTTGGCIDQKRVAKLIHTGGYLGMYGTQSPPSPPSIFNGVHAMTTLDMICDDGHMLSNSNASPVARSPTRITSLTPLTSNDCMSRRSSNGCQSPHYHFTHPSKSPAGNFRERCVMSPHQNDHFSCTCNIRFSPTLNHSPRCFEQQQQRRQTASLASPHHHACLRANNNINNSSNGDDYTDGRAQARVDPTRTSYNRHDFSILRKKQPGDDDANNKDSSSSGGGGGGGGNLLALTHSASPSVRHLGNGDFAISA